MFCTIQLSKSDSTPLYIQLAQELAKLIKQGVLKPKTKLPTIRSLSHSLNINRDTVVSAYKLLENDSLVYGHVGSGTYVAELGLEQTSVPEISYIPCSSLSFPQSYFPVSVIQNLLCEMIAIDGCSSFSDPMKRHRTALKHQITDYFHSIGIETSSAQVRLIPSIQDFWINLLKLNTSPYICVENYHDTVLSTFFKSLGLHVLEMPLTPTGMDLDTLEQTLSQYPVAFICVSSYIQNPTGICYDLPTKKRLLELAHRYHCYIVDDLTCIDFSYLTSSVAPLFSLDTYDEVITLYHFCKLYLPILTYSFAALPVSLSKQLMGLNTYTLNEHLLAYYLRSDFFAGLRPHLLEQSRTFYLMIREALSQLTEHVLTYALDGGLSFFIRPTRLSTEAFIQHFLSFGIVISPGEVFVSNPVPPWFRLAIAPLDNVQCLKLKACLLALDTVPAT